MRIREPGRALFLAGLLFTLAYYAFRLEGAPAWTCEALYLLPPALALVLLVRRGAGETGKRQRWFWRLLGLAPGVWVVGQVLWAVSVYRGLDPYAVDFLLQDSLFIAFLVPMIGAIALGPHRQRARWEPVTLVDWGLLVAAVTFVFARVVFVPFLHVGGLERTRGLLRGAETWLLVIWTLGLWLAVRDGEWRRTYGRVSLFALLYGVLSSLGNGSGGPMPPPGGPLDLAWIVPFFVLASVALPAGTASAITLSDPRIVLMAGAGPLALDLTVDRLLPQIAGSGHGEHALLLLPASVLLAIGCALRLLLEERSEARARSEARVLVEAEQRAGRLASLASMCASDVGELEGSIGDVVAHAELAASALGEKGSRVVGQARRAQAIVRDLAEALSLVRPGTRRDVDVGALLEETARQAVDEGLGLQVSLEGMAGLPPVSGDGGALAAAFLHLMRNAAQASPGGVLRVTAARAVDDLVVRFADDGPGVPVAIRHRIFDPFFTTRRVGEGLGLGLTLAHFMARNHGGSILLEPGEAGACFRLRLPIAERRLAIEGWPHWPFAGAALGSAAVATALAMLAGAEQRWAWSALFQIAAALTAAGGLAGAAWLRRGRSRSFWALLAGGAGLWAAVRAWGLARPGSAAAAASSLVMYAGMDWCWMAALLVRPDRRERGGFSGPAVLGAVAAFCLVAYLYAYLVFLPAAFSVGDVALRREIELARGLARAALTVWSAVLSLRALSSSWRRVFGRLSVILAAWAAGHTLAGHGFGAPGAFAALADLGWILPFLFLAAFGVSESLRGTLDEPLVGHGLVYPRWAAASLAALAALPAFDALMGSSGHLALDRVREELTRSTLILVGSVLACREILARREARAARALLLGTRTQLLDAEKRSRLLGRSVSELGGHFSGITALVRLLLAQPDLGVRSREDVSRIQGKVESASRILRNILALVRHSPESIGLGSINEVVQEVVEMRAAELAQDGIRLERSLSADLPQIPLDPAAIQQVLVGLVDNAAEAMRKARRSGTVTIATQREEGEMLVSVSDDGPGLPEATLRQLARPDDTRAAWVGSGLGLRLAQEVAALHGGRLTAHNRLGAGAQIEIRLPLVARAQRETVG